MKLYLEIKKCMEDSMFVENVEHPEILSISLVQPC